MIRNRLSLIVLWILVVSFSLFFAGHLFDIIALVPNWRSGTPEAVAHYRDFLSVSGPGNFFLIVLWPTLAVSVLVPIFTWPAGRSMRLISLLPLAILIGYAAWTTMYFVPINQYLGREVYDPADLKRLVDGWVFWEYPRAGLVGLGLLISILIMERYRKFSA